MQGRRETRGARGNDFTHKAKILQLINYLQQVWQLINGVGSAQGYMRIEESVTDYSTQAFTHWVRTMQWKVNEKEMKQPRKVKIKTDLRQDNLESQISESCRRMDG